MKRAGPRPMKRVGPRVYPMSFLMGDAHRSMILALQAVMPNAYLQGYAPKG